MTAKGRKPAVAQGRALPVAVEFRGLPRSGILAFPIRSLPLQHHRAS